MLDHGGGARKGTDSKGEVRTVAMSSEVGRKERRKEGAEEKQGERAGVRKDGGRRGGSRLVGYGRAGLGVG